jgi:type VI secretion system protein
MIHLLHRLPSALRLSSGLFAALLPALLLSGCSALSAVGDFISGRGATKTDLEQITVLAQDDANGTSATALDVVFVYDEKIPALLPKDAAEWFARREELHANLWRYLDIASVEVPPAYLLKAVPLPKRHESAIKVIAYANYLNKKGRKPIDLTAAVNPLLTLKDDAITFAEQGKEGSP